MGCGRWLKTLIRREGGKLNANESKEVQGVGNVPRNGLG